MSRIRADIEKENGIGISRSDGFNDFSKKRQFRHSRGSIAKHHPIDVMRQVTTILQSKKIDFKEVMTACVWIENQPKKSILPSRYPCLTTQPSDEPQPQR